MTPNQARFVEEYLLDLNATQAAIRAGYSAKTALQQGPRLLGNAGVKAAIQKALAARAKRVEVKADDVLRELLRIATTDISEAYDDEGNLKKLKDIPVDLRRAISGVEVDEIWDGYGEDRTQTGETKKLKLWDKTRALEMLGKHLKLLTDKVEHRHSFEDLTDEQLEARYQALTAKRAKE